MPLLYSLPWPARPVELCATFARKRGPFRVPAGGVLALALSLSAAASGLAARGRVSADALHNGATQRGGPFGAFDEPSLALKRLYCDHDNLPSAGGRRKRSRAGATR